MNRYLIFLLVFIGCFSISKDSKFDGRLYHDHLDEMSLSDEISRADLVKVLDVVKKVREGELDRSVILNSTYKEIIDFRDSHDSLFYKEATNSTEEQIKTIEDIMK